MAILIVDDAATDRFALALMLTDAGYSDLLQAGSADEAIACLAQRSPDDVELILTDLNMPGVNGIAACQQIKALPAWFDIPIIMGVTLVSACAIVLGNLLADLVAPFIDPRIKLR